MPAGTTSWYVKFAAKPSGPFALEQLHNLAATGVLTSDHLVSSDGQDWQKASTIPGLDFSGVKPTQTQAPGRKITAICECGSSFDVPASFAGTRRPCPSCGRKCLVASDQTSDAVARALQSMRLTKPDPPRLFGIATWAGLLVSIVTIVLALAYLLTLLLRGDVELSLLFVVVAGCILTIPGLFKLVVFLELRKGRRWAWVAVQVLAVLEFASSIAGVAQFGSLWLLHLTIPAILYGSLLPLLYTAKVQEYCSD
jgi:hypothetical protein